MSEALARLIRWTELRDFLGRACSKRLGETRKAISLLSNADSEYASSRAVQFRLLHLYRSTGEMPKALAEAKWFKSQPG